MMSEALGLSDEAGVAELRYAILISVYLVRFEVHLAEGHE
jgi:hypothetical protein